MNTRNRFRPQLEALEDREAPSTLADSTLVSPAPDASASVHSTTKHDDNGRHNGHGDNDSSNCNCGYTY
jgi:hypothetical protein